MTIHSLPSVYFLALFYFLFYPSVLGYQHLLLSDHMNDPLLSYSECPTQRERYEESRGRMKIPVERYSINRKKVHLTSKFFVHEAVLLETF